MKKVTNNQIIQMKELRNKGLSYRQIAKELNLTYHSIRYHLVEGVKEKIRNYQNNKYQNLTKEQKKNLLDSKREYQRNYHKNRYKLDPIFRSKQIERVKKC